MLKPDLQGDGGHEGEGLLNGSSAFMKETPEISLSPSVMWEHREKMATCEPGRGGSSPDTKSAGALVLDFPAPRTMGKKYLLFIRHPDYGIFVTAANEGGA